MADVAPAVRQLGRESARFFANPSNLVLISANGDRLGDLDTPAAIFLLPELGDDPEPDERVMEVQGQALRRHCKLDSRIAAHRVDGAIAAHQHLDELAQSVAIPAPYTIRKALRVRPLTHQPEFAQPRREGIRCPPVMSAGWVVRDAAPAHLQRFEVLRDHMVEIGDDFWVRVGEAWSCPGKAPFGDEVSQQTHFAQLDRCVVAEAPYPSGHADARADCNVMKRSPPLCGQERMMASNLDRATSPGRDLEARLDAAVHPGVDFLRLHRPIPAEPENRWHLPSYRGFDRQPLPRRGVDNDTIILYTLPHARPARNDDQVRVLEPTRHPIQVVEA